MKWREPDLNTGTLTQHSLHTHTDSVSVFSTSTAAAASIEPRNCKYNWNIEHHYLVQLYHGDIIIICRIRIRGCGAVIVHPW
jgi:hypothetical protein